VLGSEARTCAGDREGATAVVETAALGKSKSEIQDAKADRSEAKLESTIDESESDWAWKEWKWCLRWVVNHVAVRRPHEPLARDNDERRLLDGAWHVPGCGVGSLAAAAAWRRVTRGMIVAVQVGNC
jgi:hypothetical protein